jgi:histidine triad (HIT) family protein
MPSIFTKIIDRELPAYIIEENDFCIAFLDVFPIQKGHVLIVSKDEVDDIFDLRDEVLQNMMLMSKKISKAMRNVFECKKIGVSIIGLEVPHAHIHLVPINNLNDINFAQPKLSFNPDEMQNIVLSLKSFLK